MNGPKIFFYLAKLAYKILRPLIPVIKRYVDVYRIWKTKNMYHAGAFTVKDFCFVEKELKYEPLISVIVPVFNPKRVHLLETVYSVINQHYQNWELILVNASTDQSLREATENCSDIDVRIKVLNTQNEGIAANTNKGLEEASGEFIAFLDHDDLLHPCALHSVAEAIQISKNQPDLVYTDEDKISDGSDRYSDPHYKPGWSPDLLRNVNYINHLSVIRAAYVNKVNGLRTVCDGAQDYDLLLRVIDKCNPKIKHIPRVLYHWRSAATSTAQDISTKQYIFKAGRRAIKDHLKRNNINAKVVAIKGKPGFYEVKYPPVGFSVIVGRVSPSKYGACAAWLDQLAEELPEDTEIIVGDWYKEFSHTSRKNNVSFKYIPQTPDYWLNAVQASTKEVCICFKIAANPITSSGLTKLAGVAGSKEYAAVLPTIINKGKIIFHSGIINVAGTSQGLFEGYVFGRNTFFGNTDWVRNVDDISATVIAIKTKRLKTIIEDSGNRGYDRAATVGSLVYREEKPEFIVWAHTPFEYIGPLSFMRDSRYHRVQQFRLVPTSIMVMYADNWGETYERDED